MAAPDAVSSRVDDPASMDRTAVPDEVSSASRSSRWSRPSGSSNALDDALDDAPGPAPSLTSLVREWRWALPLAVAGVVLRLVAVAGIHLYRYFDSAEYETLDFSGRSRRPWTTPLLYHLLPDEDAWVVGVQAAIGAVAWLALAFAAAALFRRRGAQVVVATAIVALGCSAVVTNWDVTMLSEPMALSLTVLVIAGWTNFVRRPTDLGALAIVAATVPWMFVRQSLMPTAWMITFLALVALVVVLVRGRRDGADRRIATPLVLVVGGLFAGCIWATVTYGRNTEILHHNITAIVADRIAPDEERLAWFVDQGMPLPSDGRRDYGGFDEDRSFQAWVERSGTDTYARFLASHPWYSLTEPLADFVGANRSYQEVPPFSDPAAPVVTMLASAEPYGSSRHVIPEPVEDVLLRGGSVGTILTSLLVAAGWAAWRWRDADRRWIVPIATVVLAAASLYAAWHGASTELPRLGLPGAVALRVALIVLFGLLVEGELDRRDTRSA